MPRPSDMDTDEVSTQDDRAFYYGMDSDELNQLTDPFFLVAEKEEELGYPLASVN